MSAEPKLFSGAELFRLKDTHGLPLSISLDLIINGFGCAVNWIGYMEAARKAGRWDYQTVPEIEHGLLDAEIPKEYRDNVIARLKVWIVKNPHPAMQGEA